MEVEWLVLSSAQASATSACQCNLGAFHISPYNNQDALYLLVGCALNPDDLKALANISHAGVASMLTFAVSAADDQTWLVYEWRGEMLRDRLLGTGAHMTWSERLNFAGELVRLLSFLSDHVQPEFESSFIGVTPDGLPLLFGMGVSELVASNRDVQRGCPGYRCPVLAQGFSEFSEHAVEFAVGVTILELLTGQSAVEAQDLPLYLYVRKVFNENGKSLASAGSLLDPVLADECAAQLSERFLDLALACTTDYPEGRPALSELSKYMDEMRQVQGVITQGLEAAPARVCGTCGEEKPSGVFCEQQHYICTDCLTGLVVSWSERKHITTKNRGCIFCPKRFEFEGYYLENRKALCDAAPWNVEDLKGVVSDAAYAQYMDRVSKMDKQTDGSSSQKVFRTVSDAFVAIEASPSTVAARTSKDVAGLVTPIDDYGTIMTTMLPEAESTQAAADKPMMLDAAFFKQLEAEKKKIASEVKILDSMKPPEERDRANSKRDRSNSKKSARKNSMTTSSAAPSAALSSRLTTQRQVLMKLYNSTQGAQWRRANNWGKAKTFWGRAMPVGEWYHVMTNEAGDVFELELTNNRLAGAVPMDLGGLLYLTVLNLSFNALSGAIPPQLAKLEHLKGLYLNDNQLTGDLPPELQDLKSLIWLDVSNNKLSGPIPKTFGGLSELRVLALNNNMFGGAIPRELSQLLRLELLALHCNRFSGPMTEILKSNPTLKMSY